MNVETYEKNKAKIEKSHWMEDDSEYKDMMRRQNQMYYARADIDNDGNIDDIIRIDSGRYVIYRSLAYDTYFTAFDGKLEKSFKDINIPLSKAFEYHTSIIYNLFFYKGKTYIKELSYDLVEYGFSYMTIHKFDDKQELAILCLIVGKNDKEGE